MPGSDECVLVFGYDLTNTSKLMVREALVSGKRYRIQPELCLLSIPLDMNVHGFASVGCVEEEAIGAFSQNNRHALRLVDGGVNSPPRAWG